MPLADVLAVGRGPGSSPDNTPRVRLFTIEGTQLDEILTDDPSFLGGVNVAARDINGDGKDDIITAPASNYLSYIRLINAATNDDLDAFLGYAPSFRGGAYVG